MSSPQPPFRATQKGRSVYTVILTGFVALLTVLFFLAHDPLFLLMGVFLSCLVLSGIYAFLKGETWMMSIENEILSWSYARWPKSTGRIDLREVKDVVVDDCSNTLSFTFSDGSTRKVKLIGQASKLRDYLAAEFPHIRLEYLEGT